MSQPGTLNEVVGLTDRALGRIYDHVFANDDREVAGVLVGQPLEDGGVQVRSSIPAHGAQAERDSVTFTHDAWELIYRELDKEHPGEQIVGWYHSHPGFGIFFSHHDAIAHSTSFVEPWQIALVIDPQEGTQGVFGWRDGEIDWLEPETLTSREGTGGPPAAPVEPFADEAHEPDAGRTGRYDPIAIVLPFVAGLVLAVAGFGLVSGDDSSQPAPQRPAAPFSSTPDSRPSASDAQREESERERPKRRRRPSTDPDRVLPPSSPALTPEACERMYSEGNPPVACEEIVFPKESKP